MAIKSRRYKKAAQAVMQSSHNLHNKLNETVEFERRLLEMIQTREKQFHGAVCKKIKTINRRGSCPSSTPWSLPTSNF